MAFYNQKSETALQLFLQALATSRLFLLIYYQTRLNYAILYAHTSEINP